MSILTDLQIEKIITEALEFNIAHPSILANRVLGHVQLDPLPNDILIVQATAAKMGVSCVEYDLHSTPTLSEAEILLEMTSLSLVVDLLMTSIIDHQTFGNGHRLTERIASNVDVPVISLHDDMYSHPWALAEILALYENLGPLTGKNIGVAWGFGSRFVLPSVAHSLIILAPLLGANVRVIEPDKFQLLNRAKRTAQQMANQHGSSIEVSNDFSEGIQGLDAVFASNWCRLDEYQHPERNRDYALEFKDWYFTSENLPEGCYFLSELPVQQDLLASTDLLSSNLNLSGSAYLRRVKTLAAIIGHFAGGRNETGSSALV